MDLDIDRLRAIGLATRTPVLGVELLEPPLVVGW